MAWLAVYHRSTESFRSRGSAMTTFTEIVATVVVHSSAVAFSHFGLTLEPAQVELAPPPAAERVIARTRAAPPALHRKGVKLTSCPQPHHPARALTA
jgi:hypothetical protein